MRNSVTKEVFDELVREYEQPLMFSLSYHSQVVIDPPTEPNPPQAPEPFYSIVGGWSAEPIDHNSPLASGGRGYRT